MGFIKKYFKYNYNSLNWDFILVKMAKFVLYANNVLLFYVGVSNLSRSYVQYKMLYTISVQHTIRFLIELIFLRVCILLVSLLKGDSNTAIKEPIRYVQVSHWE